MEAILTKLLGSLVEGAASYGPFVLLLIYIWQSERAERLRVQEENEELRRKLAEHPVAMLERTLTALHAAKVSVDSVTTVSNAILTVITALKDSIAPRRPRT